MRAMLFGMLAVLVCHPALAEDKKDEKIDTAKLVGKWEAKDKMESKVVLEFAKDGKALLTVTRNDMEFKGEGSYKLDGNKISLTMKLGDQEQKSVRTITKLTDTDMVTTDEKGKERAFVRLKDK